MTSSRNTTSGITAPLRHRLFRDVWIAGVLSNLGTQVQAVSAAWAMTQLTNEAGPFALVQSATMLPTMIFAMVAGTLADLFDRRKVAVFGLGLATLAAAALAILWMLGAVNAGLLLVFCFVVSTGTTLYGPAWQASVREQVPPEAMASAIALNSISYNFGRSIGPAIGGVIVAVAGTSAAFGANALSFVPIMIVLLLWRRPKPISSGPREQLGRALGLGLTYVLNAPAIRLVLLRAIVTSFGGGAVLALMPLVAKKLLGGDSLTFGLLPGAFGAGAVVGAVTVPVMRRRATSETIMRVCGTVIGAVLIVMALSRNSALTGLALVPAGMCWTISTSTFNVCVQLSTPRWVSGRAISTYQAAIGAGVGLGSWVWGSVTGYAGTSTALIAAGLYTAAIQLIGLFLPMPDVAEAQDDEAEISPDPEVTLPLSGRSGPISLAVRWRIASGDVGRFRTLMEEVRRARRRNGAYHWLLGRDLIDPEVWTERFQFATWHDYLRFRKRSTISELRLLGMVRALHVGGGRPEVQRLLDRPTEDFEPDGHFDDTHATY